MPASQPELPVEWYMARAAIELNRAAKAMLAAQDHLRAAREYHMAEAVEGSSAQVLEDMAWRISNRPGVFR